MKIDYIIPTVNRPSLERTKKYIELERVTNETKPNLIICDKGKCASSNRNLGLEQVKDSDWIVFVDDDDWLKVGHSKELDKNFDIVVLRMLQGDIKIPRGCVCPENLWYGNVGINFALQTDFYLKNKIKFQEGKLGEDWLFLRPHLFKTNKERVKVTKDIFYFAPVSKFKS